MSNTIACPPGWYYCRVQDGDIHLQRYPIAAWRVEAGRPVEALLAKPGEPGLVPPSEEDRAALVGLCPPDREAQSYFDSQDLQQAVLRLHKYRIARAGGSPAQQAVLREVVMPGVGPIPVRDARPPGQQDTADWIKRAWGGNPSQG